MLGDQLDRSHQAARSSRSAGSNRDRVTLGAAELSGTGLLAATMAGVLLTDARWSAASTWPAEIRDLVSAASHLAGDGFRVGDLTVD